MPRKKKAEKPSSLPKIHGVIEGGGEVMEQQITETLEQNYMPYAMSVILSRAIPEIDGFKPSHRKLLYTMYKMGLLNSTRTKSANIVGQTMKLNPHGDSAIYDTMVRLSRGYEALLHPYVDSKGNFGKFYSRDMAWAASRYTEARLDDLCGELFGDIDKDTVDFVDNYDNTMKEPTLLPATFPSVLVNANTGIAVGMASNICPFNLSEVCQTTIALLKDKDHDILSTLIAPDFPGGGQIIYDKDTLTNIYRTGRGSFKVRARYTYDKSQNCIDITQIPPTTTVEVIVEKVVDLVRQGTNLETVHVRIGTKNNFVPTKLLQIKGGEILVCLILHFNTAAQYLEQIGDDVALKNFIIVGFQAVENFPSNGHDGLEVRISRLLTGAQRRVTLYNVDFPLAYVPAAAVHKLCHTVGNAHGAGQLLFQIQSGFFRILTAPLVNQYLIGNLLRLNGIFQKVNLQIMPQHFHHCLLNALVGNGFLGLVFIGGSVREGGNHNNQAVLYVAISDFAFVFSVAIILL